MEKITKGVRKSSVKTAIDFYNIISQNNPYSKMPKTSSLRKLVIEKGGKSIDHNKIKFFIDKCIRVHKEKNYYYFIILDDKRVENLAEQACEYSYNIKLTDTNVDCKTTKSQVIKKSKEQKNTKTISILWGLFKYQINQ
jgi:hypothetical protein